MPDLSYTEFKNNNETFRVRKDMMAAKPELVLFITMLEKELIPSPTTQGEMVDIRQHLLNLYPLMTGVQRKKLHEIMKDDATKQHLIDVKFGHAPLLPTED